MALIYKHLLDVLKVESQLNGNDEWSHAGFEALIPYFASLKASTTDDDTSDSDRLKLLPKILKCVSRILSKVVNIVETKVLHERLAIIVLDSLSSILKVLHRRSANHSLVQSIFIEDQASVVMIVLHVLSILESVSPDRGGQSHDEALTSASLDAFSQTLHTLYNINSVDDLTEEKRRNLSTHRLSASFESSLGSQAVLALLGLCRHRSKRIATAAADNLLLCMTCFSDFPHMWRSCFPGAFSGLFVLSQSGFKSGSALLGKAVLCLLRLLRNVGADALPENRQLQQCLAAAPPGPHGQGVGFTQLQNKLSRTALPEASPAVDSAATMATNASVAQGTDTVAQYAQWRVGVLQRIQLPLSAAFKEAFKLGSPALRVALVRGMAAAVRDCAAFLGARCVIDCTAALLTSAADGTPSVRAAALQAWAEVSETLRSGQYSPSDAFMNVTDGLGEKYMTAVKNANAVAALGNDSKLRDLLATVLGMGAGLQGRLLAVVRLGDNTKVLVRCASALLAPEPSVCSLRGVTASVLETRRYCWTRVHSGPTTEREVAAVEAGYHRVAWRGPQEADCRDLAHRTVLSIGRNGLLEEIFRRSRKALQRLHKYAEDGSGTQTGESRARLWAEQFSAAAGALFSCNVAVLGLASVAVMHRAPAISEAPSKQQGLVCAHCGIQENLSSTSSMLRCSRCKGAHYCCKEHQGKHWPTHKSVCAPQKAATALSQQEVGAASSDSLQSADLDSPTSLLTSPLLAVVLGSAAAALVGDASHWWSMGYTSQYPAGKIRYLVQVAVQHYLVVLEHYLSLRCASTTAAQSSASSAGAAAFALLAAGAAEGLANLAFAAGSTVFAAHMRQVLYPLLQLLVDAEPIARQAGRSSLERIALYGQHMSLAALVRSNLDYIVDTVCRELRAPTAASSTSTALIVDFVFSILDASVDSFDGATNSCPHVDDAQSNLAPMFLLRDVICDALGSVDSFSVESTYGATQLQALLRVLRVLAIRAAPAPILATLPAAVLTSPLSTAVSQPTIGPGSSCAVAAAAASLLDFTRNLLNLRQSEWPDAAAEEADSDLLSPRPRENLQKDQEEGEDPASTAPAPPAVQLLLDVLQRCCLFLTLPHTSSQLLVLDTMGAAFLRLSLPQHVAFLLPCVHTTWPVIINRVKELRQLVCQRGEGGLAEGSTVVTGRRKVLAPSSALLSLEKAETKQPASLLLLGPATAPRTPTTTTASASTASAPSLEASRALALPGMFELISVITAACTSFMTIKLKQELLSEVFALLAHFGQDYLQSSATTSAQPSPQRPQLLTYAPDSVSESTPAGKSLSRFSIDSKVKLALLRLLRHFCAVEESVTRIMREYAGALAYQILPLLAARETVEVREEAGLLLQALRRLDAPTVSLMVRCVVQRSNSAEQWLAVVHSPLIAAAFSSTTALHGSRRVAPKAEPLLQRLRSDPAVRTALDSTLTYTSKAPELPSMGAGRGWSKNLERWAAV